MAHHIVRRIPEHGDRRAHRYAGRVLIVNAFNGDPGMLADCLNGQGFCAIETHNATDAYRLASELPLSIVITDAGLSGGEDGFCLTRTFKADERLRPVPVMILADDDVVESVRTAAQRAGCDLLVAKACPPPMLLRLIDRLVQEPDPPGSGRLSAQLLRD